LTYGTVHGHSLPHRISKIQSMAVLVGCRSTVIVLPLGLDSFAAAAAIGVSQVTTARQRLRISLIFVIFEGGCR
jgi:hypothetical protein